MRYQGLLIINGYIVKYRMERRGEQSISLSMSRIAEMTTSAVTNQEKGGQIKRDGKERTHVHK